MPKSRRQSQCPSTPSMGVLNIEINSLVNMSMSQNSWKTYQKAVESFGQFRLVYNYEDNWPIPIDKLAKYVVYLSCQGLTVSTVSTYLSGLSFVHKINDLEGHTKSIIITKMVEGLRRKKTHYARCQKTHYAHFTRASNTFDSCIT